MEEKGVNPEEAMNEIQKIFRERGHKALEMAKKEVLEEKVESKEVKAAVRYFMNQYWHDVARPSLLSLVCEAVGGDPNATTSIAIPMTLISGAIDIHDDVIDQSKIKNDKQTVYGKYGKDVALLVGDALLFKGLTLLNKAAMVKGIEAEKVKIITDIIKNAFFELGDAEALELQFRANLDVSPEEYLQVLRKKAADVEAHTRTGAILGGASPNKIEALGTYGRLLGMLILLRDDWLDILDVEESCSRIKRESLPLPLLYGLQNPAVKNELRAILLKKNVTRGDAKTILATIQKTDVPQRYAKLMDEMAVDATLKLKRQKLKCDNLELILEATLISPNETESK